MEGVEYNKSASGALSFQVNNLSDELKGVIRNTLSSICYGAAKAKRESVLYTYAQTLIQFLDRYNSKTANTKKGMIGELLAHVLLMHFETKFESVNPYFNLEEENIKKGFDLVLRDTASSELWFAEVKSGESKAQSNIKKTASLLSLAKNGLKENLNSDRFALWQNAINGAGIAIKCSNLKSEIESILEEYAVKAISDASESTDYNALLVAVCYTGESVFACDEEFEKKHLTQLEKGDFKTLVSVSIQKPTYDAVVEFLQAETDNG